MLVAMVTTLATAINKQLNLASGSANLMHIEYNAFLQANYIIIKEAIQKYMQANLINI